MYILSLLIGRHCDQEEQGRGRERGGGGATRPRNLEVVGGGGAAHRPDKPFLILRCLHFSGKRGAGDGDRAGDKKPGGLKEVATGEKLPRHRLSLRRGDEHEGHNGRVASGCIDSASAAA